ncbi:MAG: HAD family hydrolase [Anaerolineales bacterium]
MSSGLRAVVFDLDDTLYPETEFVAGGMRAAARWAARQAGIGVQIVEAELQESSRTGPHGKAFDTWLQRRNLPADWRRDLVNAYRTHRPRIRLYPDARRALDRIGRSYEMGLVTEGDSAAQRAKLTALGVESLFRAVVILGRDEPGNWKPSPEPFARCLEALGVPAREAVYVGDNPRKDFRGARQIGMRTVRVRRPGGVYADLEPASDADAADVELADLDGLEAVLELPHGEPG